MVRTTCAGHAHSGRHRVQGVLMGCVEHVQGILTHKGQTRVILAHKDER